MVDEKQTVGWSGFALFIAVVAGSACFLSQSSGGLTAEPPFADEGAVLAQSHYYRLLAERRFSDPDWIDHAAYDHQPLYKYLIGLALHVSGQYESVPRTLEDFWRWIDGGVRAPEVDRKLLTARWAMLLASSLGIGFVFAFTRRLAGSLAGLLAVVVFLSSPLVFTHARRAMIDLAATGLSVGVLWASARFAVDASSQRSKLFDWVWLAVLAALAPLAKWNAAASCLAVFAIAIFGLALGPGRIRWTGVGIVGAMAAAAALFVALDPFYWSNPEPQELSMRLSQVDPRSAAEYRKLSKATAWDRGRHALDYRRGAMAAARTMFPNDYLSPADRPGAILLEGMGRWTLGNRLYSVPEAEKPRSQRHQLRDWINALIVAPLALIGILACIRQGWEERRNAIFPIHWLLVGWIGIDVVLLLGNLTADWDRYYLSVVAWSSIAAVIGVWSLLRGVIAQLKLKPKELTPL